MRFMSFRQRRSFLTLGFRRWAVGIRGIKRSDFNGGKADFSIYYVGLYSSIRLSEGGFVYEVLLW